MKRELVAEMSEMFTLQNLLGVEVVASMSTFTSASDRDWASIIITNTEDTTSGIN